MDDRDALFGAVFEKVIYSHDETVWMMKALEDSARARLIAQLQVPIVRLNNALLAQQIALAEEAAEKAQLEREIEDLLDVEEMEQKFGRF